MEKKPRDYTPEERQFITGFRKRPGMYLGTDGILSDFVHFLDGWDVSVYFRGKNVQKLIPDGFPEFVGNYYHDTTNMGWFNMILRREPDERKAFQIFWNLLDAYLISLGYEPIPEDTAEPEPFTHRDDIYPVYYQDLPLLAESYMRTFNGAPWFDRWDRETALLRLKDLYRTPGFLGLSLWQDNMPLGAVLGRKERYYDGNCFQIIEFWVEPRVQQMGYGGRLMDELKQWLSDVDWNIRKIYLITMHSAQTERFYEKNGFIQQDGLCIMQLPELNVLEKS